jgi:hypothetical protein
MTALGQKRRTSDRAYVFRFAPKRTAALAIYFAFIKLAFIAGAADREVPAGAN